MDLALLGLLKKAECRVVHRHEVIILPSFDDVSQIFTAGLSVKLKLGACG